LRRSSELKYNNAVPKKWSDELKKQQQRAADQTTVTFSCSKQLRQQVKVASAADRRSVSNWIVCRLEEALVAKGRKSAAAR
jgi:hypothetical protein